MEITNKFNYHRQNQDLLSKCSKQCNNNTQPLESFLKSFPDFFNYVKPMYGIRAKKMTLYDLRFCIEEIYSLAFTKYTYLLRFISKSGNTLQETEKMWPKFSKFTYDYFENKYNKKKFIDQNCMNIMLTTEFFESQYSDIRVFSCFLSGKFSIDDLLFFLFLRSNIEKELGILFLEKAKDEIKIQHKENKEYIFIDLYLNCQQSSKILCQIFNLDDEILINQALKKIEPFLVKDPHNINFNCITTTNFLVCLVDDFHNSRILFKESKGINNVPFVFNKQNEFFDLSNNNEDNSHEMYTNMLYYFNNQSGLSFEDNLKNVLLTYIKEKEILIFFDKYFEGEFNENTKNFEEIIYDIRNCVTKKIYILIEFIFNEDIKSFNVGFSIDSDNKNNDFNELVSIKNKLLEFKNILQLPEEYVEKFCFKLMSIPQLLNQISKIIDIKKQE